MTEDHDLKFKAFKTLFQNVTNPIKKTRKFDKK